MPEPTRPVDEVRRELVKAIKATELDGWTSDRPPSVQALRSSELVRIVAARLTRRGGRDGAR